MVEKRETSNTGLIKVAVLGGTGNMGKHFVRQALDAGHDLRLLVRNASKVEPREDACVEVVVGDATKPEDVANVVAGVDVAENIECFRWSVAWAMWASSGSWKHHLTTF